MAGPNDMYGRNADLAAERDAILSLPPDQQQAALMAMSQRRSGVPEIPGGYRNAKFAADLPAPTGRFANVSEAPPPSISGKEAEPAATGAASSSSNPLSGLSPGVQSMLGQLRDLNRRAGENAAGVAGVEQRQRERIAEGERDSSRAYADTQRQLTQNLDRQMRPIPEFIPTQETARDIGTLASLLMVAGATLGGKGKQGALMAVQSMTGMMNGYRQGRIDLYQRERQNFETGVRQVQAQNQQLQQAFERAQRLAQTDMEAAQRNFRLDAVRLGADLPRLAGERAGIEGDRQVLQTTATMMSQIEQRKAAAEQAAAVRAQTVRDQDARDERLRAARVADQQDQERRAQAEADRVRGITRQAEAERNARELGEQRDRDYRNVEGQARFLEQQGLPREVVRRNLGPPEVQRVAARLQAAENTYSLAQAIQNNPQAAGLAGQLISRLDRLDLSRYGTEGDPSALGRILNLFVEQQPLQGTPDQVAQARSIAKLAVDVINARALSASGGNRMLVSELNIMKSQIGIDNLSPLSSVTTYNNMADKDLEELAALGIGEYVPALRDRVRAHSDAYVARVYPPVGGGGNTATSNARQPGRMQQQQNRAATHRYVPGTGVVPVE